MLRVLRAGLVTSLLMVGLFGCSEQPHENTDVTLYRDQFGVAHVFGTTDGDAALGFGYAQAEDNLGQIERNFMRALGRGSEAFGEPEVWRDWIVRSLDIPELAMRDYANARPDVKALLNGYAAGINTYVEEGRGELTHLDRIEPWHPLALIRYLYYARGFVFGAGLTQSDMTAAIHVVGGLPQYDAAYVQEPQPFGVLGSNSWAANGDKINEGQSLLFINPHLPFAGPSQVYEAHIMSESGWNFTGYTRFGFPLPYVGFNPHLGWASTDNNSDQADLYTIHFTSDDYQTYAYAGGTRDATVWNETYIIKDGSNERTITLQSVATHYGAILGLRDGTPLAVRMATFEEPGWLDQWYDMSRAETLDAFLEVAGRLKMQFGNYMLADDTGNILFVYNGAIPVRDPQFDWTKPVDGSDPQTEWQGYHTLAELPQVLNPESNWVQNTNSTPFTTTVGDDNPRPEDFPPYMVQEPDNERSRNARRILTSLPSFDFSTWAAMTYDGYLMTAEENLPTMIEKVQSNDPDLQAALDVLRAWDFRSDVNSVATTLFVHWAEAVNGIRSRTNMLPQASPEQLTAGLARTLSALQEHHGTWQVPWGEINRLIRGASEGTFRYCPDCMSAPNPAAPSIMGGSPVMNAFSETFGGVRWGVHGNSYVAVVQFGDKVSARSLHTFGPSADLSSPYFFSEAPRHQTGDYKDAWLYLDDVIANAQRTYHPAKLESDGAAQK